MPPPAMPDCDSAMDCCYSRREYWVCGDARYPGKCVSDEDGSNGQTVMIWPEVQDVPPIPVAASASRNAVRHREG